MNTRTPLPDAISRRKLVGLTIGGAIAGGTWSTGFAILARGTHPQFFVIGANGWQLVLVEHGQRRALIGIGDFEGDIREYVAKLKTSLRQHVDIVIGESGFLSELTTLTDQWRGPVRVQLDGSSFAPSSSQLVHLRDRTDVGIGDFTLTLERLPDGEWSYGTSASQSTWIGHLSLGSLRVAIAPSLNVAANHAQPDSALTMAPQGDFARLQRVLPSSGIVTNASSVRDAVTASSDTSATTLVRTFRADIAAFRIRHGRIELPDWTQSVSR